MDSLIHKELKNSWIDESFKQKVQQSLDNMRKIPFGGDLKDFSLQKLCSSNSKSELSFDLSLTAKETVVNNESINNPLNNDLKKDYGNDYIERLNQLKIESRGFLTGSIDLIFSRNDPYGEEKWWVLDWKSNWIGSNNLEEELVTCGPANYSQDSMKKAMIEHHYPLQAYLYLVALHRYLRWRKKEYLASKNLGGYIYLFLRGIPSLSEINKSQINQSIPGIFSKRINPETIMELDRSLSNGNQYNDL